MQIPWRGVWKSPRTADHDVDRTKKFSESLARITKNEWDLGFASYSNIKWSFRVYSDICGNIMLR